jgi:hypothetical protein
MDFYFLFLGECNVHLPRQPQAQTLHGPQPLGGEAPLPSL